MIKAGLPEDFCTCPKGRGKDKKGVSSFVYYASAMLLLKGPKYSVWGRGKSNNRSSRASGPSKSISATEDVILPLALAPSIHTNNKGMSQRNSLYFVFTAAYTDAKDECWGPHAPRFLIDGRAKNVTYSGETKMRC